MVADGAVSRIGERYVLLAGRSGPNLAEDVIRISDMTPIVSKAQRGSYTSIYGDEKLSNADWEGILSDLEQVKYSILRKIDPSMRGPLVSSDLSKQSLAKFVGRKFAVVISFNGTELATLSSAEIISKRREAMRLIAEKKGIGMDELTAALALNPLEIGQIMQPLVSSGYATIDKDNKVSYTLEVEG